VLALLLTALATVYPAIRAATHWRGRSAALRVVHGAYEWLIGTRYLRSTHRRGSCVRRAHSYAG